MYLIHHVRQLKLVLHIVLYDFNVRSYKTRKLIKYDNIVSLCVTTLTSQEMGERECQNCIIFSISEQINIILIIYIVV